MEKISFKLLPYEYPNNLFLQLLEGPVDIYRPESTLEGELVLTETCEEIEREFREMFPSIGEGEDGILIDYILKCSNANYSYEYEKAQMFVSYFKRDSVEDIAKKFGVSEKLVIHNINNIWNRAFRFFMGRKERLNDLRIMFLELHFIRYINTYDANIFERTVYTTKPETEEDIKLREKLKELNIRTIQDILCISFEAYRNADEKVQKFLTEKLDEYGDGLRYEDEVIESYIAFKKSASPLIDLWSKFV